MHKLMIDDLYASMPWDEIDTVVFDVGNVLVYYNPQELLEEYVPDHPELYPMLKRRVFASPYWAMMDRGAMTLAEACEAMAGQDECLRPIVRKLMYDWWPLKPIQEGVDALKAIKARGKKLYVLSNYNAEPFAVPRKLYDFFDLFDGMVISSEEMLIKPDPAIYHLLEKRYDIDPARTMFIDDSYANIEAAIHCGWHGLLYNEPGKLKAFLGVE